MVNWFCSASLCFNNFRSKTANGEPLKYYRLPRDSKVQAKYMHLLKTDGINFRNGHICCEHFSSGIRKNKTDLPDIAAPLSQIPIMKEKVEKLKRRLSKKKRNKYNRCRKRKFKKV